MLISHNTEDRVCLVYPIGKMWKTDAEQFDLYFQDLIPLPGISIIAIDFKGISIVDSFALGVILKIEKEMRAANKQLVLFNMNHEQMRLFEISGLKDYIRMHPAGEIPNLDEN